MSAWGKKPAPAIDHNAYQPDRLPCGCQVAGELVVSRCAELEKLHRSWIIAESLARPSGQRELEGFTDMLKQLVLDHLNQVSSSNNAVQKHFKKSKGN